MPYLFDVLPLPSGCRFTGLSHSSSSPHDRSGDVVHGAFIALPSDQHGELEADFLTSHLPFSLGTVIGLFPDGSPWLLLLQQASAAIGGQEQQRLGLEASLTRALEFNPGAVVEDSRSWARADLEAVYAGRGVIAGLHTWSTVDLVLGLVAECCGVQLRTMVERQAAGCAIPGLAHACQLEVLEDVFVAWHEGLLSAPRGHLCDQCGLDEVVPVVWGMPLLDEDGPRHDVIYAGCSVPPEPWTEQCRACYATYGALRLWDADVTMYITPLDLD